MSDKMDIDSLLKVLSNPYRREILRLLSMGDRYAYELAKILKITPRAITKHLEQLKENGLVEAESRKSDIGPAREYFSLNRGLVFRISIGQNLYYSNVSNLQEEDQPRVSPTMHLGSAPETVEVYDVLEQGLRYLPSIKRELEFLEMQQTRLLRKYQGMLLHIGEMLKKVGVTQEETEIILALLENGGRMTQDELLKNGSHSPVTLSPIIDSLMEKGIIGYNVLVEEGKPPVNEYHLKLGTEE